MYANNYGFPNGAPPSQNPHLPAQGPNPNQPPQQQMMYNPQQFPMGAQGPPFPGPPNMMPGAGPAGGMMQNPGMPHMAAANGQSKNFLICPYHTSSLSSQAYLLASPAPLLPCHHLPSSWMCAPVSAREAAARTHARGSA